MVCQRGYCPFLDYPVEPGNDPAMQDGNADERQDYSDSVSSVERIASSVCPLTLAPWDKIITYSTERIRGQAFICSFLVEIVSRNHPAMQDDYTHKTSDYSDRKRRDACSVLRRGKGGGGW
jgi:hypothetical protein